MRCALRYSIGKNTDKHWYYLILIVTQSQAFDRLCLGYDCLVDIDWGQCPRRRVNVMCEDLVSCIFSLHFRVQFSIVCSWSWGLAEARVGSGWVVEMTVSSAMVLRIVLSDCGISAVYIVYSSGRKMLPWVTHVLEMVGRFRCCILSRSFCFVSMIIGDTSTMGGIFIWFLAGGPDAILCRTLGWHPRRWLSSTVDHGMLCLLYL